MPTCVAAWASRYPGWAQLVMKFPGRFRSARPEATDEGAGQAPDESSDDRSGDVERIDRLCEKGVEASTGRAACVIAPVCLDGAQRHPESGLVDSRRLQGITSSPRRQPAPAEEHLDRSGGFRSRSCRWSHPMMAVEIWPCRL